MATRLGTQAAQRHVLATAAGVVLGTRHCANGLAAVTTMVTAPDGATPFGLVLLAAVAGWAAFRLATRSRSALFGAVDLALTLTVCASIPAITNDPHFYESNSAPLAIAGTSVVTFGLILPARWSAVVTVLVGAAYAWGASRVIGWENVPSVGALYYFVVQWVTTTVIRRTTLRVAVAVDRARTDRKAAAATDQVSGAIRDNAREYLALLHDTAASTLLLVGQGAALPPDRLAAQAQRDLAVLARGSGREGDAELEMVAALRDALSTVSTPIVWTGLAALRINAAQGDAVTAAAREACNNVDRHSRATRIIVDVGAHRVTVSDDGAGFDPDTSRKGHGIAESLVGRMGRIGGQASVLSTVGVGTTVELDWAVQGDCVKLPRRQDDSHARSIADADRLAERVRLSFGVVLIVYALLNLIFAAQFTLRSGTHPGLEAALVALAAGAVVVATPHVLGRRLPEAALCAAAGVLAVVAVVQPLLLHPDELGGRTQWTQSVIGWCLLPLLLAVPTRIAASLLAGYWFVPAIINLVRDPSGGTVLNIGLGTASILTLQLFALYFATLMRDAAEAAHAEAEEYWEQETRAKVERAVREDYRHRTASLASSVVPLLATLSGGTTVDADIRRRALAESRRLRMLFDNAATFSHSLLVALRPAIDTAEARGASVTLHADDDLPELPADERAVFVGPIVEALGRTRSSARLVLTATSDELTASIICDIGPSPPGFANLPLEQNTRVETVQLADSSWLTVRHDRRTGAPGGDGVARVGVSVGR